MDWNSFADWALKGLLGGAMGYAIHTLTHLRSSVEELKDKMTSNLEKVSWHEKTIERIESRIWDLEAGKRRKM